MVTQIKTDEVSHEKFSYSSSVASDVWRPKADARSCEWWYFDALSDDGREAIVVIFLDNFIFSPRYKKLFGTYDSAPQTPQNAVSDNQLIQPRVPALIFIYYRDGKPLYRTINEFAPEQFSADENKPSCRLGESQFSFESAPYGSGYLLHISAALRKNRTLKATLEWLSIESDFLPTKTEIADRPNSHNWNLVAPRSDVTGKIEIFSRNQRREEVTHFRGTGYHEHNTDSGWLAESVQDWQWGRAHFTDATAVYYRYKECGNSNDSSPTTKLFLIKNGELKILEAFCDEIDFRRNIFGMKYPESLIFSTRENVKLTVRQTKLVDASFFYLRFLSETEIKCPDGSRHEAFALTEHLSPKALKFRWLNWLTGMRISWNGKGSKLP